MKRNNLILRTNRSRAFSLIILALILGAFALIPVTLLIFELQRVSLAKQELRAVCEAAALAGAATLAGSDLTNTTQAQINATNTALNTFQSNSVIGYSMIGTTLVSSPGAIPPAGSANLLIQFLNPNNNMQPVQTGDPSGKILQATGTLSLTPCFASILHLGPVTISESASGGVPLLDVVLCFDLSGSMDDQTPVTFVRRQWSSQNNNTQYVVVPTQSGAPAGPLASGLLFNILGPPATGSRTNAVYPQWLSISKNSDHAYPLYFSEAGTAVGLRGATNTSPPGNCPPGRAGTGNSYTYTDLVVNLDGQLTFGGITSGGYNFPNVATLVEAARGNLENASVFQSSKASTALPYITPQAGYQAQYFTLAATQLQPISAAQSAAVNFLSIMNTNTNAHFGFVAFADNAGTSQTSTISESNIDSSYGAGGTGNFLLPQVALDPTPANSNYSTIQALIPQTCANTATNIGDAINQAVQQLKTSSRQGATKAIVLFTDGEPTQGGPLNSDPNSNARAAAVAAQQAGIPIYSIGLAQNTQIVPSETAILNDTNSDPSSGGISAIAGNGGKFFLVTNAANLRLTFENVARQLTQLVR